MFNVYFDVANNFHLITNFGVRIRSAKNSHVAMNSSKGLNLMH